MSIERPAGEVMRKRSQEIVPSTGTLEHFGLRRTPPRVVEIGFGPHPVPLYGNLQFGEYIGFDIADFSNDYLSASLMHDRTRKFREVVAHNRHGEKVAFIYANADGNISGLPIADNSASEIYMANVLNVHSPNGDLERSALLDESKRILASDGKLVVKTSWYDDALKELQKEHAEQLLKNRGFTIVNTCVYNSSEYDELEVRYGKTPWQYVLPALIYQQDAAEYSAYFIVAEKKA